MPAHAATRRRRKTAAGAAPFGSDDASRAAADRPLPSHLRPGSQRPLRKSPKKWSRPRSPIRSRPAPILWRGSRLSPSAAAVLSLACARQRLTDTTLGQGDSGSRGLRRSTDRAPRHARLYCVCRPSRCRCSWVVSTVLARTVAFDNSYWIQMTAAVVTCPELRQTVERGLARTAGTLAGAAIATLVAGPLHPHGAALSGLSWSSPPSPTLMLFVNYVTFAVCVTAYVAFLLTLAGAAHGSLVAHRIASTVLAPRSPGSAKRCSPAWSARPPREPPAKMRTTRNAPDAHGASVDVTVKTTPGRID